VTNATRQKQQQQQQQQQQQRWIKKRELWFPLALFFFISKAELSKN